MAIKILGHKYANISKSECEVCKQVKKTGILHRDSLEIWDYEYFSICKECLASEGYSVIKLKKGEEESPIFFR